MEKYICIHGHFYQPPRENPWLETIELQDSAYPFHDWNERITAECYRNNGASRVVDDQNRILQIVNNYARISFNFGPTLLSWMEEKMPDAYRAIIAADRESQTLFSGHGSALAQVYNHMIMPLANFRDKRTQVIWGIRDFEHRFGRKPEGMWLAETAVDIETLEVLAEQGIKFTILSQYQAARVRYRGNDYWEDATGGRIDPSSVYLQRLPSGRKINLFFYDGPISQAVAFEQLLTSGEKLAHRLMGAFHDGRDWPQLVHIATDGETYGHHHRFGDMALAYALNYMDSQDWVKLTNYGEYLERYPPMHEVHILENTSWSCYHGVERWRNNCGCNSGGSPEHWNQEWRRPLREALDWLRDQIGPHYEKRTRQIFKDPWRSRDDYIFFVLNRSGENGEQFLARHALNGRNGQSYLSDSDKFTALKLMELQRHAMLMYTSCGWFFDELSGIETVQIIQYAGRVIQLAEQVLGLSLEGEFLNKLEHARSNQPHYGHGRHIYEHFVKPAMVDLKQVGAHYAISSVFTSYPKVSTLFCYAADCEHIQMFESHQVKLVIGRVRIISAITWEHVLLTFGALHFGDYNVTCGVREFHGQAGYDALLQHAHHAIEHQHVAEAIHLLDQHFVDVTYSIESLFRDEQRRILEIVLNSTLAEAEMAYRSIYDRHVPLMRFLSELGTPTPRAFRTAAEFAINSYLKRAFEDDDPDIERIKILFEEAQTEQIILDTATISFKLGQCIERMMQRFAHNHHDLYLLEKLAATAGLVRTLSFDVDIWTSQNIFYDMLQSVYPRFRERAEHHDGMAQAWVHHFSVLGQNVQVRGSEIVLYH
ncbi:MAG: DUF3536 domain-containing protein [Chloroflexaceae bacterium]|nr:DUF3536 domain-containing protein [Chloroflexaceae bacterium]